MKYLDLQQLVWQFVTLKRPRREMCSEDRAALIDRRNEAVRRPVGFDRVTKA